MHERLTALSLAAGLFAGLAICQGPPDWPGHGTPPDPQTMIKMRVDRLATLLNLTDAQKTSATTIFTNAYTAGEDVRTKLQANRQSLSDAIKKNDTAAIDTLSATAGTLSGQLTAIESKAEAAFYALLTPDQQAKYDSMPHHGPGGPGGPGGRMGPGGFGGSRNRNPSQQ